MSATPLKSYPPPASAAEPVPIRSAAAVPFRLEAVIVCVNYGDILAHTLPDNRILFDRVVVVTAPEDKETRRVCEYWHIRCIQTDVTHSRWG